MFTARYGLIPYIKQITFRLVKVKRLIQGVIFLICGTISFKYKIVIICSSKFCFSFEITVHAGNRILYVKYFRNGPLACKVDCLTIKTKPYASNYTVIGDRKHLSLYLFFEIISPARLLVLKAIRVRAHIQQESNMAPCHRKVILF